LPYREHAWRQNKSGETSLRGAQLADITALMRVDRDNPFITALEDELLDGHDQLDLGSVFGFIPKLNFQ
jgi:hypothetical protein